MLNELTIKNKVIGLKQSLREIADGNALKAFVAQDCAPDIYNKIVTLCNEKNVEIEYVETMAQLGHACKIDVKAAIATVIIS